MVFTLHVLSEAIAWGTVDSTHVEQQFSAMTLDETTDPIGRELQ